MIKNLEILVLRKDFREEVSKLRKKWKIPTRGFEYNSEKISLEELMVGKIKTRKSLGLLENASFNADVKSICLDDRFDISNRMFEPIRNHVLYESIGGVSNYFKFIKKAKVILLSDDDFPDKRLFIEIFADTTQEDIQEIWTAKVKRLQKSLKGFEEGRYTYPKNFNRDLMIYQLKIEGLSHADIASRVNKAAGYTISNPAYLGKDDIKNIVARFKRVNGIL